MTKKYWLVSLFVILTALLLVTSPVLAQTLQTSPEGSLQNGDKIVIADTYRLLSGETLQGNLAIIGGTATIEKGAVIKGDIILVGGTITNSGTVHGNLVAVGGAASLGENSLLDGDIVSVGASLNRASTAMVTGNIMEQTPTQAITSNGINLNTNRSPIAKLTSAAFVSFALAVLAVLIGLILPEPTRRVADAVLHEPLIAGAVGLLTLVGLPILLFVMVITLILIPVAILVAIVFGLAILFGWIGFGYEMGRRMSQLLHVHWSVPIAAGIGVLLLTIAVGVLNLIPCLGGIVVFILSLFGLGAVVMTSFGLKNASSSGPDVPPTPALPVEPPPHASM